MSVDSNWNERNALTTVMTASHIHLLILERFASRTNFSIQKSIQQSSELGQVQAIVGLSDLYIISIL